LFIFRKRAEQVFIAVHFTDLQKGEILGC